MTPLDAGLRARLTKAPHVSQSSRSHASASMALSCSRALVYKVQGVAEDGPLSTALLLTFAIGDFVHAHIQETLRSQHLDFRDEQRFDLGAVTGRVDGIYTHTDGRPVLVEIKSMDKDPYGRAVDADTPKDEHLLQANIGAVAFGAAWLRIVYAPKSPLPGKPSLLDWTLPADLDAGQREIERMGRIVAYVEEGKSVPRRYKGKQVDPATQRGWPCAWCGYRKRCLEDGE